MKSIRYLLILCGLAVIVRIVSAAGLVSLPGDVDDFLNGFIIGTLIGAAIAWWSQRT